MLFQRRKYYLDSGEKRLVLIQHPVTRIQNHVLILKNSLSFRRVDTTLMNLTNA